MLYALLRQLARVALRWYYRDIGVRGLDRLPRRGPVLLVVNHPNALVDALVVGALLPRRLTITAKSTIFVNPVVDRLLRTVGVLPLRRASDIRREARERRAAGARLDPRRNEETFRAVIDALANGGAVLIFPEGKSHDEPALAPLRTGAARLALAARADGRVADLRIVPVGLIFERKEAPRSRVLVDVGAPLAMAEWAAPEGMTPVAALTHEIAARLRAVTLDAASAEIAQRELAVLLAALEETAPRVGTVRPLEEDIRLARRVAALEQRLLADAHPALRERGTLLRARISAVDEVLEPLRLRPEDVAISTRRGPALRFTLREGALLVVAGPVALWGRVHHWLPFHLARAIAERTAPDASRDQPAMRTIVAGAGLVLLWYAVVFALVSHFARAPLAFLWVASLPLAADVDLRLRDRMARGRERVRAYFALRARPALQRELVAELEWVGREARSIDALAP